ncbi:cupin domain-containing protein [Paramicrobacterium chengjingii]|uniref:Cupin domain-containing protein n=1 Tax=Paramicrobacterium chengjingii TaxID=2769067 RepID=A0ABX6YHB0_9MICO|nr:cupin domain-containing protein [Microbacterium chengjingii]QPZ37831.1 cupin domain-containing protein [Microbacterium chengjingii]
MQKTSLTALARHELDHALTSSSGRSAKTVFGGREHALRQTLIALRNDETMGDHESPGDATVYVISGRIELTTSDASWTGWKGDLIIVPDQTHNVRALEDSVFLLTVAKR